MFLFIVGRAFLLSLLPYTPWIHSVSCLFLQGAKNQGFSPPEICTEPRREGKKLSGPFLLRAMPIGKKTTNEKDS